MGSVLGQLVEYFSRPFKARPVLITAAGAGNWIVDARGFWKLTVLAHAGSTVVIHRIDNPKDWSTPAGTERDVVGPVAGAALAIEVDWPFYLIATSGGNCTICLI